MNFKRETTSKLFFGIADKNRNIIHAEYFDAKNIFSRPFIQNLKHKPNRFHDLSKKLRTNFKNRDWRTVPNIKYNKYNVSLEGMVKQNTMDERMQKTELY